MNKKTHGYAHTFFVCKKTGRGARVAEVLVFHVSRFFFFWACDTNASISRLDYGTSRGEILVSIK